MKFRINQKTQTPIGAGIIQGAWEGSRLLIRLPVNDQTRPYLTQQNCQTPAASVSGLWVFEVGELK